MINKTHRWADVETLSFHGMGGSKIRLSDQAIDLSFLHDNMVSNTFHLKKEF